MSRLKAETHRRRVRAWNNARHGRRLDWVSRHDERSRLYGIADVLSPAPIWSRGWAGPLTFDVLDQGAEGACVGAACAQVMNSAPRERRPALTMADAGAWYRLAQTLDSIPGESYVGTSVRAGMAAGTQMGAWDEYRWAFGVDELAAGVAQVGPAVIGVPWYSGMYVQDPDAPVTISGDPVGGHSLVLLAYVETGGPIHDGPGFVWLNSWGPSYGRDGRAFVSVDVLAELLADKGEAAIPIPRPAVAA